MPKSKKKSNSPDSAKTDRVKVSVRSVSRQWVKALRRERKANPPIDQILAQQNFRGTILSRTHDPKIREQRERLERSISVETQARQLYAQYADFGVTWAAAVQAVKTNWVAQFMVKWSDRAAAAKGATSA